MKKAIIKLDETLTQALDDVLTKWKFKDEISFIKYALALFLVHEKDYFNVYYEKEYKAIAPIYHYLKTEEKHEN